MVRGVNMLMPHAFYYSVRGPRRDERPPQVGPNGKWWDRFGPFAEMCRRVCQLNAGSRHVCELAILTDAVHCPWRSAQVGLENQWDFNYLEDRLLADCEITADGVRIAGMHYRAVIVEDETLLTPGVRERLAAMEPGRLIVGLDDLCERIGRWCGKDVRVAECPALRYRHVVKDGRDVYELFNEGAEPIDAAMAVGAEGDWAWIDPATGLADGARDAGRVMLGGHEMMLLIVEKANEGRDVDGG